MGIMGKNTAKRFAWAASALCAVLFFQNCEFIAGPLANNSASDKSLDSSGNGQPYDGKPSDVPYVASGVCPDGTVVQSRILMKTASEGTLYRENCTTGQPKALKAGDVKMLSDSRLSFGGRTYELERPAIPLPGVITWFLQLTGMLEERPAGIYIVDMFENSAAQIAELKGAGHTVICRMSGGTKEAWTPDADKFPASAVGNRAYGSREEWFVDIRSAAVREIMIERLDLARSKGCHGIDFDAVDGYKNNSGFALTKDLQLEYNQWLAFAAHDRELILSLNNVAELSQPLSNVFDFAIAEQCFENDECDAHAAFVARGKPVLAVEYQPLTAAQCDQAKNSLLSLIYLNQELDGREYGSCPN